MVHGVGDVCAHGTPLAFAFISAVFVDLPLTRVFVMDRIVRAFLIEEAKVVKRVIKSQQNTAGGRS